MVAEMWLILELTGSGVAVGVTSALQFLPVLVFGAWGGVLADRWPKRRLLIVTQTAMAIPALTLWALTATGAVVPWMVFALVFVRGAGQLDRQPDPAELRDRDGGRRPGRQRGRPQQRPRPLRPDLRPGRRRDPDRDRRRRPLLPDQRGDVRGDDLRPAPHGPGAARPGRSCPPTATSAAASRAAIRYVRGEPKLAIPLAMMVVVGTLGFNFQVLLPLLGRFTFDGGAAAYTALAVAMAVGSVAGALATGARGRVSERLLVGAAVGVRARRPARRRRPDAAARDGRAGPARLCDASPSPPASTRPCSSRPRPAMRGRVMALYSVVFLGSTPIGGPIVGWLSEVAGPRAGLVLGRARRARRRGRRRDRLRPPARPGLQRGADAARARRERRASRPRTGGGGGGFAVGARSRYRPGVRISRTGSKAEEGST